MEPLALGAALAALLIASIALTIGILALVEARALKNATHSIQYVTAEQVLADAPHAPSDKDLERAAKREGLVPLNDDETFEDL